MENVDARRDYEDHMAGGPRLHVDTSYRGLEGRGGEIYPDAEHEMMYKGDLVDCSRRMSPDQIVSYYERMYDKLVGSGGLAGASRMRVLNVMNDNEELYSVRRLVDELMTADSAAGRALKQRSAFA